MIMNPWSILVLCSFIPPSFAQSNGMDMSMDGPMDLAVGNMLPYLHFTPGDTVWFLGWVPKSAGAMVGTCVGIFLLSIMERWLAACLSIAEQHWAESAAVPIIKRTGGINPHSLPSRSSALSSSSSTSKKYNGHLPQFVPEIDITRGILFAAQRFLQVLFMLIAMTFQAAFILSIVVGSGVGETLFGRFLSSHSVDH